MKKIGSLICNARKKAGYTQEAFASKLGLSPQAISKWENDVGLPDVALLPEIASILGLSLDELFGVAENDGAYLCECFGDLPLVSSFGGVGCYSDKTLESKTENGNLLVFSDGSTAYVRERRAENRGLGEIRFCGKTKEKQRLSQGAKKRSENLEDFDSIEISFGLPVEVRIVTADRGSFEAVGDADFIDVLTVTNREGCLSVSAQLNNTYYNKFAENTLCIFTPFTSGKKLKIRIAGSCNCNVEPSFGSFELSISGSGDVKASECAKIDASIAGSGDLCVCAITEEAKISISGSGDVSVKEGKNVSVSVAGSGDVTVGNAVGNFSARVSGSGDVKLGGELDALKLVINGSGDFDGRELTVSEADIEVNGSGDVKIKRIKERSFEKIGENCTFTVNTRG